MRVDMFEPGNEAALKRTRGPRTLTAAVTTRLADRMALEPTAVDAAMEDESLPVAKRAAHGAHIMRPSDGGGSSESQLLESLCEQLEMLDEQQRQIRRLLAQAGHRRVDRAEL